MGGGVSSQAGGECLEGFHRGGAGGFSSVAFCFRGIALQAIVIDASGVLALSVEVAELLDLGGCHGSVCAMCGEALAS